LPIICENNVTFDIGKVRFMENLKGNFLRDKNYFPF
jgi:hypothetical protein